MSFSPSSRRACALAPCMLRACQLLCDFPRCGVWRTGIRAARAAARDKWWCGAPLLRRLPQFKQLLVADSRASVGRGEVDHARRDPPVTHRLLLDGGNVELRPFTKRPRDAVGVTVLSHAAAVGQVALTLRGWGIKRGT